MNDIEYIFKYDKIDMSNGLKLNTDMSEKEIDELYLNSSRSNLHYFEWKVYRDNFYKYFFEKSKSPKKLYQAGFLDNKIDINKINDFYQIEKLTTPFNKLNFSNEKDNIILLSSGSFAPLHDGHINNMELAKKYLEENSNNNVAGGYFSLSHDEYVLSKKTQDPTMNCHKRSYIANSKLFENNWIMVDQWQSMYLKHEINFTDTINRLKLYIKHHFKKDVEIYFVYGDDNIYFNNAFLVNGKGICINRHDKLIDMNNNIIYIKENKYKEISSTKIRSQNNISINKQSSCNGTYFIRDDISESFDVDIKGKEYFKKEFKLILEKYINNDIEYLSLKKQKEYINNMKINNTISLDIFINGNYNLGLSRLFNFSDSNIKGEKLINRPGTPSLDEQISIIEKNIDYTLIDDDSVSGQTLELIKNNCTKNNINIKDILLLSNYEKKEVFDVIDLRDFCIGANNSGLVCNLPNGKHIRVPYILKYIDLYTRASINFDKISDFRKDVLKLNYYFYYKYNDKISLKDANDSLYILLEYLGYKIKKDMKLYEVIKLIMNDNHF